MESKNIILLVILSSLVVTSGCTGLQNSGLGGLFGGNENETQIVSKEALKIINLDIDPFKVQSGGSTNLKLVVQNPTSNKVRIPVGSKGNKIISNYCPDMFRVEEFSMKKDGRKESGEELTLEESEKATFNWKLKSRSVPRELECDISVRPTVIDKSNAFQQVEIKKSKDIESSKLDFGRDEQSSLRISTELKDDGSFIEGEKVKIEFVLENIGSGEIFIEKEDVKLEHEGLSGSCDIQAEEVIKEGEKSSFDCEFERRNLNKLSQIFDIYIEVSYELTLRREIKSKVSP